MRLLCDTNTTAAAVRALRSAGHDVIYSAERQIDPGDAALMQEALGQDRILITKDHDIGELVYARGIAHAGVVWIDDLGDAAAESALLISVLADMADEVQRGAFVRAGRWGARIGR